MPELPEVETTVQGLIRHVEGQMITSVIFHRENLRYSLEQDWITQIQGQTIKHISRRAKSIVMQLQVGFIVWHLGMTGSLRVSQKSEERRKHDHVQCYLGDGRILRFHDPRRFGFLKYFASREELLESQLSLGVEPLSDNFTGEYLWQLSRHKQQAVKNFIMNQAIVVGVGNIYACEALFLAGIRPQKACGKITRAKYEQLANCIKIVLVKAIEQGGTTLKDFENAEAKPGYFQQSLAVYGRAGEICFQCQKTIENIKLAGRSSFYCATCQRG